MNRPGKDLAFAIALALLLAAAFGALLRDPRFVPTGASRAAWTSLAR